MFFVLLFSVVFFFLSYKAERYKGIYANSPGYKTNLPVTHTVHQISQIIAGLDIFLIQKTKSQENFIAFSCQGWLYCCEILLDFGLHASFLATFSLCGRLGQSPKSDQ